MKEVLHFLKFQLIFSYYIFEISPKNKRNCSCTRTKTFTPFQLARRTRGRKYRLYSVICNQIEVIKIKVRVEYMQRTIAQRDAAESKFASIEKI